MEFYIDLNKAMMNFAKLVKKPVQVKGKNGKVFTRMQWVSPTEASTGMGVRKITSQHGLKQAMKDGIHHHEDFHQAMKDQGVHPDTFEDHHPHFFLPETEESANNREDRMSEMEEKHGFGAVVDAGDHEYSFMHEGYIPDHEHTVYNEYDFVPREMTGMDHDKFLSEHGIHPEVHGIVKMMEALDLSGRGQSYQKVHDISDELSKHWPTIKRHVEDKIKEDLKDSDDPDRIFIRDVQLTALSDGNMNHSLNMAHHPVIARAAVNKILGEGVADKFREHIGNACLSVNFPGKYREGIEKDGYKSSQLMDFVRNNIGEDGVKDLENILVNHSGFNEQIGAIRKLMREDGSYSWNDVIERADAEHAAIGMSMDDRKPTYVALNPTNRDTGPCNFYGNRWLKVDDSILKHCTATFDDSFSTSKSVAKVFSMEHLKDMFILKQLDKGEDSGINDESWAMNWGEIPIELQYHKPELTTSQFEVMPDPAEEARKKATAETAKVINDTFSDTDLGEIENTGKSFWDMGDKHEVWKTSSGHWIVTSEQHNGQIKVELHGKDPLKGGKLITSKMVHPKGAELKVADSDDYDDLFDDDEEEHDPELDGDLDASDDIDLDDLGDLDLGDDDLDDLLLVDDDDDDLPF